MSTNISNRIKSFLPLKTVFLFIFTIIVVLIVYLSNNTFSKIARNYENAIYEKTTEELLSQYKMLFNERLQNSFILATTIAKYPAIENYFLSNPKEDLNFNNILGLLHSKKEYVNLQIELLSKKGVSLQRSWINYIGDNIFQDNLYLNNLLLESRPINSVEANRFGLTISNKIPIKSHGETIGYLGMNLPFDDLLEKFDEKGFKSIILLNKQDSSKIDQEISFSSNFLDGVYIANKNADSYVMKLTKEIGIDRYFLTNWIEPFKVHKPSGYLIIKHEIKNAGGYTLANLFFFKSIETIGMEELDYIQDAHFTTTMLIILFIAFVLNFFYSRKKLQIVETENRALIIRNEELFIKSTELDYHEKKIENLFHAQPNLMMMHNGVEIIDANQRFVGFFNRFETVDGFRQKHKCVSELFVEYKAPYYIHEQYIKGKFWVDYILENPKRLYKVVIPYKDSKMQKDHHFIIKLNEIDYAGKVDERLVIIALVDITQDLVNYKSIEDLDKNEK